MKKFIGIFCLFTLLTVTSVAAQQRLVRLTRYEGERITGVTASSAFDVHLIQSDQTKAVVEISEELEERLELSFSNDGIVRIGLRSNSRSGRSRNTVSKLTVYLPTITHLKASGAVTIETSGNFRSEATNITMSGASDLKSLNLTTGRLKVDCTGASDATIQGEANVLEARVAGASDLDLSLKCISATLNSAGASDLKISGEATEATMNVTGGSDLAASGFAVKRLTITASGASDAKVWVTDELKGSASSAATIRYKGTPATFDTKSSSAGSVRKMN